MLYYNIWPKAHRMRNLDLLGAGVLERFGIASVAAALLWLVVAWALA